MATVDLVMPKMGESIMEATILKWHKKPGDAVRMDETVLDIATDKVDSEVPSTEEGVIEELLYKENDVVPVGAVIARIKTNVDEPVSKAEPEDHVYPQEEAEIFVQSKPATAPTPVASSNSGSNYAANNNSRFYSPLVLNIAAQEGIPLSELERLPGTGNEGRVTKKDILDYVNRKRNGRTSSGEVSHQPIAVESRRNANVDENRQTPAAYQTPTTYSGNVEIIEMDRMRKLIADHMVRSKQTSAHVTSFSEADVTNVVLWRDKVKKDFEKREGTKLTFTPLFIEAVVRCIKKFPLINSSVEGERILVKKDINIGMATALPNGNLIVPIIKKCRSVKFSGIGQTSKRTGR